jgi:hypothetical protein
MSLPSVVADMLKVAFLVLSKEDITNRRRDGPGRQVICCCRMRTVSLCILACCGVLAQTQSPQSLADIKTIFVDSLGQGEGPSVIRGKIINRLASSDRFQVVLDREKADAVIVGSASETSRAHYVDGTGGTGFDATVVVRLVTKDQRILWTSEAKNGRFGQRSASSSVADHIVKDLLKAAKKK